MARGTRGLQLWATEHRGAVVAGTLAIAAFLTTLIIGSKPLARSKLTECDRGTATEQK
jgi:hypothetical protein